MLFTHSHADHILGLDEIRRFNTLQGAPIPCYANGTAWDILKRSFYYAFDGLPRLGGGVPQVDDIEPTGAVHDRRRARRAGAGVARRRCRSSGYRFGSFAYLTDCSRIPDESWPLLGGVRDARHRCAARRAAPHALHRGGGARGDRARRVRGGRTSRT